MVAHRDAFRAHALDGAMLYFQPSTGLNVRVETAETVASRRAAPRLVAFGITNRCNLACGFCSRDVRAASAWTRDTAYAALRELADAGVLEVAFGGGEPFVFPGFVELLRDLHRDTPLALNVTTNGTRIDARVAADIAGLVGIVRLSIYEEWRTAAGHLTDAGVRWGANVLVDARALETLPALLDALATAGADDVSLLRYVGADPALHLDLGALKRLDAVIAASPLPARVSVCFGPRLHAPLLFAGVDGSGDCGAGRDFVAVTADRTVRGCSFQDGGVAVETGADILRAWRGGALTGASTRRGCARAEGGGAAGGTQRGVRVWRAFSGNNSGECIMVARFETVEAAEGYLGELLPGFVPRAPIPAAWEAIFRAEGYPLPEHPWTPEELAQVGRSVFARSDGAEDSLAYLRALALLRGGSVEPGGVHLHGRLGTVCAVATRDGAEAKALQATLGRGRTRAFRRGTTVIAGGPLGDTGPPTGEADRGLAGDARALATVLGNRPHAITLAELDAPESLTRALQRLGHTPAPGVRALLTFRDADAAARFAERHDGPLARARQILVLDAPFTRRDLQAAVRKGAAYELLPTSACATWLYLACRDPYDGRTLDTGALATELSAGARPLGLTEPVEVAWRLDNRVCYRATTAAPGALLAAAGTTAERHDLVVRFGAERPEPLTWAVRGLLDELKRSRRR